MNKFDVHDQALNYYITHKVVKVLQSTYSFNVKLWMNRTRRFSVKLHMYLS